METKRFENKAGLSTHSDNKIFIKRDGLGDCWSVLSTGGSSQATVLFSFDQDGQAWDAAKKIAEAIDADFYGKTDPRRM